jgi:galactonate dehydratase
VLDAARSVSGALVGGGADPAQALALLGKPATLVEAAAISAIDQALHDILARRRGISLAAFIGGERRDRIGLYANINRRTSDRSPGGFAESARTALQAGHSAIKIAPFDEVTPAVCAGGEFSSFLDRGLERIAAVREVIGPRRRLMVDCHWRFTEERALEAIDACSAFSLHWFECPVDESPEFLPAIVRLRKRAHSKGMLLAGGEKVFGLDGLRPFISSEAYDVIMPDVKYAGGLAEMLRMAEALNRAGIAFSPHNPTGPIAHAASLEICAAAGETDLLEHQFDESPLFDSLVHAELPAAEGGVVTLEPSRVGLGVSLDTDLHGLAAE